VTSGSDGSVAEARARWARGAKELLGQTIGGKYLIEKILGRGGMGTIYLAEQRPLGRKVALKVLHSNLGEHGADPEFQKRFLLEAATLSQLAHPNIVVVHDYGSLEGDEAACFMVMELLEGQTISQALADGPFEAPRALRVTREIARALRAAHDLGVIHRDLKPGNVMLSEGPEGEVVKVLDFGLVKVLRDDSEELTAEGRFLGSPRYMAPEQIQRLAMDGRTDLYALGVILYRMLSGDVPFAGDHAVQTLMAHLQKPVPPIAEKTGVEVPPRVEAIAMKLMEKNPDDRYPTAQALMGAIDAVWSHITNEPVVMSGEHMRPPELASSDENTAPSMATAQMAGGQMAEGAHAASSAGTPVSARYPIPEGPIPESGAEPAKKPAWALVALAAIGVAAGIGGAALVVELAMGPADDGADAVVQTPEPTPEPSPRNGEPANVGDGQGSVAVDPVQIPSDGARPFRLTIESDPPGATVTRDGERVGETPLTLDMDSTELETDAASFVLTMRGHSPYRFTQGPSSEDVMVEGRLARIATTRHGGGTRHGSTEPENTSAGHGGDMSIKTTR
jgi:serine/threonine-protein kinase